MKPLGRSARLYGAVLAALLGIGLLAGCGSDPEMSVPGPDYASATGGGQKLDFPSTPKRKNYPNACLLIPDASAQVLLGSPATKTRTVAGCSWSTGVAAEPSLTVSFVEIGSDASDVYQQRRSSESASGAVNGVGGQNRIYRINDDMTTRIDVLKSNVFFRVDVLSATTAEQDLATAERIGTRVAQLINEQVA